MKQSILFFLLCFIVAFSALAQTSAVAHKSHSGTSISIPEPLDGGFGNPPDELTKIIFLNDTAIIEVRQRWGSKAEVWDTVWNHPVFCKPGVTLDSLKKRYPDLEFKGFKKSRGGYNSGGIYHKSRRRNIDNRSGLMESPSEKGFRYFTFAGLMVLIGSVAYVYNRKAQNRSDA